MRVTRVDISNILSISNMTFSFGDSGLVLVDGWNADDNTANGAGKTAIFNALSFGLYDKVPRKISKTEILRRGTKRGFSTVHVDSGEDKWVVERHRPNKVLFTKNGVEQDITQAEFEKEIGLSYTQFLIVMYAAQSEGKKDFFLQLMNLERFAVSKKEVDVNIKEQEKKAADLDKVIDVAKSKKEVYQEQMYDVEDLRGKIYQLDYSDLQQKMDELSKVRYPDLSKYKDLDSKAAERLEKLNKHKHEEIQLAQELKMLNHSMSEHMNTPIADSHIMCPHCENTVVLGSRALTVDQARNKHDSRTLMIRNQISSVENRLVDLGPVDDDINKVRQLRNKLKQKMEEESAHAFNAGEELTALNCQMQTRIRQIRELESKIEASDAAASKILELDKIIDSSTVKLDEVNGELELLQTVAAILSPTGAPAYIMDSVVDVFNDKIADYVSMIWPNASYSIQTFKENKDKSVKAKFSEQLIIGGQSTSTGSLSGGEFKCMSLAMDFAVIDVLESMFSMNVNPIILDEPFEGLDASNRERVVHLLERIAENRQIVVVDHASEAKAMFSDTVKIVKRNGVSSMISDTI